MLSLSVKAKTVPTFFVQSICAKLSRSVPSDTPAVPIWRSKRVDRAIKKATRKADDF
jgi:hypothetical protein